MPPLNRESIDSNHSHNHTTLTDDNTLTNDSRRSAASADGNDAGKAASSVVFSSLHPSQERIGEKGSFQEERMDTSCNSQQVPRSISLDDENSVGVDGAYNNATAPSFDPNHNNQRLNPSTLPRPTSSTSLNGSDGSNNYNFKERKRRLWSWISNLWRKTTCQPTQTETLLQSRTHRTFCLLRWNETTASGWHMIKVWVFGMLTPIGIVTWIFTHQVTTVLASIVVLPGIAILQGSLAILKYRIQFGDSPLPKAPSHGIVKCVSKNTYPTNGGGLYRAASNKYGSNGGISERTNTLYGDCSTSFQGFVDPEHLHHPTSSTSSHSIETPLRLLVIGDSLAIGVGQSATATPIMPESIAKSLSKAMNGRPVLWTCHGAPGASAGWIVRELERSIQQGQFVQASPPYGRAYPARSSSISSNRNVTDSHPKDESSSFADGDSCSSSDDSTVPLVIEAVAPTGLQLGNDHDQELKTWSDRLKEHKIRFDPNVLGPFDIAVVLTGSNDLKSAFFPFLLTGEDAEFRRQAQQRGGGYGNELTRILQVLNRRMRMRLQTLRESVEAAKERVLESVDNIRERLNTQDINTISGRGDFTGARPRTNQRRTGRAFENGNVDAAVQLENGEGNKDTASLLEGDEIMEGTTHTRTSLHSSPHFPMVVLPGMAARSLPIFEPAPLRWLAVPIVDIMDSHKRKLARYHDGEVLFIDAPTCEELADFSRKHGIYWQEVMDDRVLLNLRGIKRKHARTIESDMAAYFAKKAQTAKLGTLPHRRRHYSMISVDGIHPNDQGYDFWGRYIAHAIVEEWKRKQELLGSSSNFV